MSGIGHWWQARSERERRLLLVMLALVGAVALWLLAIRPLGDRLDEARRRHGEAVVALAEARAGADAARSAGRTGAPTGPVEPLVRRTAAEAGFADAQVAPQGPAAATVTVASARPQALFGWIARLEQAGLAVERLEARANADRTVAAEFALEARR